MWDSCNCTPSSQPCLTGSLLSTQTSVSLIKARADCTQALQLLTCSSLPSLTHLNEPQRGQPCIALITQTLRLRAAGPPARQQSDIRDSPPPKKRLLRCKERDGPSHCCCSSHVGCTERKELGPLPTQGSVACPVDLTHLSLAAKHSFDPTDRRGEYFSSSSPTANRS